FGAPEDLRVEQRFGRRQEPELPVLQLERLEHAVRRQGRQRELLDDDIRPPDGSDHGLAVGAGLSERGVNSLRGRRATGDRNPRVPRDPSLVERTLEHHRAHDPGTDVEAYGALSIKELHQPTPLTGPGPSSSSRWTRTRLPRARLLPAARRVSTSPGIGSGRVRPR